jgi:hypothetical protein
MATRYNYTGGIVTNGLVLNLDAAKVDSYPGTGTAWNDISGNNNNGTLTNGPTFSGIGKQASIVFDGVDDYVNGLGPLPSFSQGLTVNCVVNPTNASDSIFYSIFSYGNYLRRSSDTYLTSLEINSAQVIYSIGSIPINTYTIVSTTYDNTDIKHYINGSLAGTKSSAGTLTNTQFPFPGQTLYSVGAFILGGGFWYKGNISSVLSYNRALSAAEVSQNFNALRSRYGI